MRRRSTSTRTSERSSARCDADGIHLLAVSDLRIGRYGYALHYEDECIGTLVVGTHYVLNLTIALDPLSAHGYDGHVPGYAIHILNDYDDSSSMRVLATVIIAIVLLLPYVPADAASDDTIGIDSIDELMGSLK